MLIKVETLLTQWKSIIYSVFFLYITSVLSFAEASMH